MQFPVKGPYVITINFRGLIIGFHSFSKYTGRSSVSAAVGAGETVVTRDRQGA